MIFSVNSFLVHLALIVGNGKKYLNVPKQNRFFLINKICNKKIALTFQLRVVIIIFFTILKHHYKK